MPQLIARAFRTKALVLPEGADSRTRGDFSHTLATMFEQVIENALTIRALRAQVAAKQVELAALRSAVPAQRTAAVIDLDTHRQRRLAGRCTS